MLSTPNGAQLERALGTLDFMVSIDPYLNETTRHAHVLLPPTTALEREHYDVVFHVLAVRNTVQVVAGAVRARRRDAQHDWEIFQALTRRLRRAGRGRLLRPSARLVDRLATPRRLLDLGLRAGPYGFRSPQRLSLAKLEANPHGIDLGPLEPSPARTAGDAGQADRARARGCSSRTSPASSPSCCPRPAPRTASCSSSGGAICAATTRGCTTASAW